MLDLNEEISASYYADADAWAPQQIGLVLNDVLSPLAASFPTISFAGLEFIQVEADAWVDGALQQSHGGSDEVFVQVSDTLRMIDGNLKFGSITIATFNKNVHLEQGAYGPFLTDG